MTYKVRKSDDHQLPILGLIEEIMRQSYLKKTFIEKYQQEAERWQLFTRQINNS